jgi:hypothetical protein
MVLECKDLPAMDRNGMRWDPLHLCRPFQCHFTHYLSSCSDPYIKVTILPERKPKFETRIKRNTLNPVGTNLACLLPILSFAGLQRDFHLQSESNTKSIYIVCILFTLIHCCPHSRSHMLIWGGKRWKLWPMTLTDSAKTIGDLHCDL